MTFAMFYSEEIQNEVGEGIWAWNESNGATQGDFSPPGTAVDNLTDGIREAPQQLRLTSEL